jgi:hypothetical protein
VDESSLGDLEGLAEECRRQGRVLQETQRGLQQISCTATSPRRVVSVCAGHGGKVREVVFIGDGYKRLAPRELGEVVLSTVREAQDLAVVEAARVLAPTMPAGLDPLRVLRGEVELADILPVRPEMHDAVGDMFGQNG